MKKITYEMPDDLTPVRMAAEPEVMYGIRHQIDVFSPKQFQALTEKLPFIQQEWADVLHISDRTLQRYLKEGKPFEGLYAEHLHQLENMAELGMQVFEDAASLNQWLRQSKPVLGNTLDFATLRSFWGVKLISQELGRIAHGVYI